MAETTDWRVVLDLMFYAVLSSWVSFFPMMLISSFGGITKETILVPLLYT